MRYVKYLVKMVRLLCSTGWGGSIQDRLLLVGGAFCSCFHHQDAEEEEEEDVDDVEEEEEDDDVEEEEENDAEEDEVPKYYCQWTTTYYVSGNSWSILLGVLDFEGTKVLLAKELLCLMTFSLCPLTIFT